MKGIVLDTFDFKVDTGRLFKTLAIEEGNDDAQRVAQLTAGAEKIGRPKVLYGPAYIESKGDDFIVIEGIKLTSRVLAVNLSSVYRVFPYVATCGREMDEWAETVNDPLESYWLDAIKLAVLGSAIKELEIHLSDHFNPGKTSRMNPGSLQDWPIKEQRHLFAILGDTKSTVGVELTDSFLMLPVKSVSGIIFPGEENYENCRLCPRENCPGRRAGYDSGLYNKKYEKK